MLRINTNDNAQQHRATTSTMDDDSISNHSHNSDAGSAVESNTLLRNRGRRRSSSSTFGSMLRRLCCVGSDRCFLVVLLCTFIAVALYDQYEIHGIQQQLVQEHDKVDQLKNLLGIHESVIERFNSSVTNRDVMSRLTSLETNLSLTTQHVHDQLQQVSYDISSQLNHTLDKLSKTVEEAELAIGREVDKVKQDVDTYVITTQAQFSMENSFMVYQLAGTFTLLSCLISMWHMTAHLRKMNQPDVQRKILAILWMSPIYAITSWFSLVFHNAEGYLAIIKDGYEAYIIYQFLAFLIAVLGKGDRNAVVTLLSRHADHLTPPFRLFGCFEICGWCIPAPYENNWALADAILLQCQAFALQFVFFRPVTTTGMVLCKQFDWGSHSASGAGGGGDDNSSSAMDATADATIDALKSPQTYLTIIQNISIFVAFAGLLKFYHAVDSELAWCRPFAKFLCIKGVVFMTFWQGLAISVLAETTDMGGESSEEWAKSAQNFLICLEMLLFSIAHFYCFPTDEWEEGYKVKHSHGLGDTVALGDFVQDIKLILRSNSNSKRKSKKKLDPLPETIPEESDGDTEAASVATSSDDYDVERAVAEALEESLGMCSDDPDIIEAKKRLLASKVLSPEYFEVAEGTRFRFDDDDDDDDDYDIDSHLMIREDQHIHRKQHASEEQESKKSSGKDKRGSSSGGMNEERTPREEKKEEKPSPPTETTPLRPSIFTVVASIVEKEGEEDLLVINNANGNSQETSSSTESGRSTFSADANADTTTAEENEHQSSTNKTN